LPLRPNRTHHQNQPIDAGHISLSTNGQPHPSRDATNRTPLNAHAKPQRSDLRQGTPRDAPEPDSP
jgi:hypothetical protein